MDIKRILENEELAEELIDRLSAEDARESIGAPRGISDLVSGIRGITEGRESTLDTGMEAIVREYGRPVLYIQGGKIQEPALEFWKARLAPARARIEAMIPSVGRVELRDHPSYPWVGTGWMVAPDVMVTNRHVAVVFSRREKDGFVFRTNPEGQTIQARIDFLQEHERPAQSEYRIREILHIEDDAEGAPDLAFLKVDQESYDGDPLPAPIRLASADAGSDQVVGAIGYAAWDGRRNPGEAMPRIFKNTYNVKRLHPGEIMEIRAPYVTHDCSTLGGNSGSVLVDFGTGHAVGLHFAGSFLAQNYAVKASTVAQRMEALGIASTQKV